jgi:CheY-like chemotaxis protein
VCISSTVGAVIASRTPPDNPIGWLFCVVGLLFAATHFSAEYAIYTLLAAPDSLLPRGCLDPVADTEVVGEASSGDEAAELAQKLGPKVILMDIKMPGMNGIEATREILRVSPQAGVLVLNMFEDDDSMFAAMRAGVKGYLLKDSGGEAVFGPGWPSASWATSPLPGRPHRNAPSRSSPSAKRRSSLSRA